MEEIKQAFQNVKFDIDSLKFELGKLREELDSIHKTLYFFRNKLKNLEGFTSTHNSTQKQENPSENQLNQTTSTDTSPLKPLKGQYIPISTGNEGVSTDRQTDRQTVRQTQNLDNGGILNEFGLSTIGNIKESETDQESINNASEILDKLDSIKKELRLKFKRLTNQEMLVFSTIYQLNEENAEVTYKSLAEKLKLSQSSIRDYVQRVINKGIPIEKEKELNKKIILNISNNITKIASLSTIMSLREL